jgi:uncharacterized protein YfaA (DUF2138 family)
MESKEQKLPVPENQQKAQLKPPLISKWKKVFFFLLFFLVSISIYIISEHNQNKAIQSLKSEIASLEKLLVLRPPPIKIDIAKPDALIITKSFSQLPGDLIKHSFIKDLIDKNIFNFYQNNASLLGLRGAVKRISFEQNTTVLDKLLKFAFNKPAELAFWKGHNGQLEYFMLVFKNSGALGLSEKLTWLAEKDERLNYIGRRLFGQNKVSTYELNYATKRKIFISFSSENIFVYSHQGITLPEKKAQEGWIPKIKEIFGFKSAIGVFASLFGVSDESIKHSLLISATYLSFGYQRFFPSIMAIRFDLKENLLKTFVLTGKNENKDVVNSSIIWEALPLNPGLCLALPIDPTEVKSGFKSFSPEIRNKLFGIFDEIESSTAICWYPDSKFYTPLIIVKTGGLENKIEEISYIFNELIGNLEAKVETNSYQKPFPVDRKKLTAGYIWTRNVSSPFGLLNNPAEKMNNMKFKKYLKITLAYYKEYLIFSPDNKLVRKSIEILEKRYPPISDSLQKGNSNKLLILHPKELSELLKKSILEGLPSNKDAVFKEALSNNFFPIVDKFSDFANVGLGMPISSKVETGRWQRLKWENLN